MYVSIHLQVDDQVVLNVDVYDEGNLVIPPLTYPRPPDCVEKNGAAQLLKQNWY